MDTEKPTYTTEIVEVPGMRFGAKRVAVHSFVLPSGRQGRWESVRLSDKPAALLLGITAEKKIVLVRLFRFPVGDFIVSGKDGSGALLVLQERKSKYVLIKRLLSRDTMTVNGAIHEITRGIAHLNSLTLDNDISFKRHRELSESLGSLIYFCHPYHSWEKGGVENMNKLIRRYIPKRTDISRLRDEFVQEVQDKFNHRPRKCLGFKTPYEVMIENGQFCDILKTKNTSCEVNNLKAECPN